MRLRETTPTATPAAAPIDVDQLTSELRQLEQEAAHLEQRRAKIAPDLDTAAAIGDGPRQGVARDALSEIAGRLDIIARRQAEIVALVEQSCRSAVADWERRWAAHVVESQQERQRRRQACQDAFATYLATLDSLKTHPGEVDQASNRLSSERGEIIRQHDSWHGANSLPAPDMRLAERQLDAAEWRSALQGANDLAQANGHFFTFAPGLPRVQRIA